jgi:hypothetical protein
VATL